MHHQYLSDHGLSSAVVGQNIYLAFTAISVSQNLYLIKYVALTPGANGTLVPGVPDTIELDKGFIPYRRAIFSKDRNDATFLTYFGLRRKTSRMVYRRALSGTTPVHSEQGLPKETIQGYSEAILGNGTRVQIGRIASNISIKYAINTNPTNSVDVYGTDRRYTGYISRLTIIGNSDVALAKTNDPNKLIAFWVDSNNNDLYGSIFLGQPDFIRNPADTTKEGNLLKTYLFSSSP